jgi:tetratricopeptide (TPR) repeat protein
LKNTFDVHLHNKQQIDLSPQRMVVYCFSKIIEATDSKHNTYFLFFYKDNFLTGCKLNEIAIHSYLQKALTNGIEFDGHHPLTINLLTQRQSYSFTRLHLLFKKIEQTYSSHETSYIYTFFDTILSKEKIKKYIKDKFYQCRRDGQMQAAYKLLTIYTDFAPSDQFGKDLINNLQFQSYKDRYEDNTLLRKYDPLYFEKRCFTNLDEPAFHSSHITLLTEQKRYIDLLAVRIKMLQYEKNKDNLVSIKQLISMQFEKNDYQRFLQFLIHTNPDMTEFHQELLDALIQSEEHDRIVKLLTQSKTPVTDAQKEAIIQSFLCASLETFSPLFDQLNVKILQLFQDDKNVLEKVVVRCVSSFLHEYNLFEIKDWFEPFHNEGIQLAMEQKLDLMKAYEDDPDKQLSLGELYLFFEQPVKSIECFKWEMELYPENPTPVRKLIKLYQDIGQTEEAKAYQQLLIQM